MAPHLHRLMLLAVLLVLTLNNCDTSTPPSRQLVVVEDGEAPAIAARLLFGLGPSPLPAGTGAMMAALLSEPYSPAADSTLGQLRDHGVTIRAACEREVFTIDVECPPSVWAAALPLLARHLGPQTLEGLRLDELRLQQHAMIEKLRHDPLALSRAVFWSAVYPEGPGGLAAGTDRGVEQVSVENLRTFRATFLSNANVYAGLAGPVTVAMASAWETQVMAALPPGSQPASHPNPVHPDGLNVRIVELPEAESTYVLIGRALTHTCRDTAAWVMAAGAVYHALPGASRNGIDQFLRQERGLCEELEMSTGLAVAGTDGARYQSGELSANDFLTVRAAFSPVNALYATRILIKELTDYNAAGLTTEELQSYVGYLQKSHEGASPAERMRAQLAQRWLRCPPPIQPEPRGAYPLSTARIRQSVRAAFDPTDLWVIFVTSDVRTLSANLLGGTVSFTYPEWVDAREMRRLDQEYAAYRPFWEAAKTSLVRAPEFFR
ncbi:MAG TPA: insulinase family protein [bacterium]|nr:insulinase family protein [bacterium]